MTELASHPGATVPDAAPAVRAPRLLVVIVNYRTAAVALDCLRSLAPQMDGDRFGAVVVDNDSRDGSIEVLQRAKRENNWTWLHVVDAGRNAGFGAGNNAGVAFGLAMAPPPDAFFLLNPDTVAPPGALERIAGELDARPECGVLGCSLRGPAGNLHSNAFRFPSILAEFEQGVRFGPVSRLLERKRVVRVPPGEPCECEWVSGAAMVVRREAWERIGPMDEGFFLYYEEIDFCRRARALGIPVRYLPGVDIVHLEGVATDCGHRAGEKREHKRRPRWWYDSRRRYFVKHHGWPAMLAADALWALGRLTLVTRKALRLGGDTSADPLRHSADLLGGDLRALFQRSSP